MVFLELAWFAIYLVDYLRATRTRRWRLMQNTFINLPAFAVHLRVAGANNSIVRDAKVFLASPWSRRRLTMGPYSMDLRERVAAAIDEGEGCERQIAKRFRVSVSFVTRLLQRRRDAGTLAPKPHGGGPRPVLGFPEQVRLAMLIAEHPDATLNQLKEWGGFACTLTTLWRTLRRFRLTYKKKTLHAGRAGHSRGAGQAAEIPGEGAANRGKTAGFRRRDGG